MVAKVNKRRVDIFKTVLMSLIVFFLSNNVFAQNAPPSVILSSYSISGNLLTDKVVTLHLVLSNTSRNVNVQDVLVSYTSANNIFLTISGISNQFFIPSIPAGNSITYDLNVHVNNAVPNDNLCFSFDVTFFDPINGEGSNSFSINDYARSSNAIQLLGMEVVEVNQLDEGRINVTFKATVLNHSNFMAQNIAMGLKGNLQDFDVSIPLGEIGPGLHYIREFNLNFLPDVNPVFNVNFNFTDIGGTSYYSDTSQISVNIRRHLDDNVKKNFNLNIIGFIVTFILLLGWVFGYRMMLRKKRSF